ncbi:MAG: hypothetical protein ACOCP4_02605 [Candidatus Woesearchaeota archaeon]
MFNFKNQVEWNNRILLTGTSGAGKSWFRDFLILHYIRNNKRRYYVVIDDRENNAKNLYEKANFHLEQYSRSVSEKNINWKKYIRYHEKIYIVPTNVTQEDIKILINNIILALWELTDALLIIDEANQFLKPGIFEPEEMRRFLRGGRKDGLDSMVITHRVVDLAPNLVALFNRHISFRVTEKNSVQRLEQYFDQFYQPSSSLLDPELRGKDKKDLQKMINKYSKPENFIKNLPNRCFLYSDTENGEQEISSTNILKI